MMLPLFLFAFIFLFKYSWQPKLLDEEQTTVYKKRGRKEFAFTARFAAAHRLLSSEDLIFFIFLLIHAIVNFYRALEESSLTILKSTEPNLLKKYHVLHEEPGREMQPPLS